MAVIKLTERTLSTLPPSTESAQSYYWDSELTGFGVVVGRTGRKTFVARGRVNGELRKRSIGEAGKPRDADGIAWNVATARIEARKLIGEMAGGAVPATKVERVSHAVGGPTLGDAFDLHVARMTAKHATARSLTLIEQERDKYLDEWLKRPLKSITRTDVRELHEQLSEDHGPFLANRVMRHVRAAWNTALREHDLPANPTVAVNWNKEHRRQEPIPWPKLPAWFTTVNALEPIIADGKRVGERPGVLGDFMQLALLTGLRKTDCATVRWEHVNLTDKSKASRVWNTTRAKWDAVELPPRAMLRPNPKGGRDRAFSIPLSTAIIELLEKRERENKARGDDGGWVFPSHALKERMCPACSALGMPKHEAGSVTHLADPKHQPWDATTKSKATAAHALPSPHRLRDTYTTALAALDPPVSGYVIDVLTNHRPPRGTVTAGYVMLASDDLRSAQERVSQLLLGKMRA